MTRVKDHVMELIQDENLDATIEVVIKDDENNTHDMDFQMETTFDGSYVSLVVNLNRYTVIDTDDLNELKNKADRTDDLEQQISELQDKIDSLEE